MKLTAKAKPMSDIKTIFIAGILMSSGITSAETLEIGLQKQLLVDDYFIAEKQNITREMGVVKKVGISYSADGIHWSEYNGGMSERHYSRGRNLKIRLKFYLHNTKLYAFQIK